MSTRAYMAWAGDDPGEGACLVFHHTAQDAKALAFPLVQQWTLCEYVDVRVRWLRSGCEWAREKDGPHVVESPAGCERCERWHADPPNADGLCEACAEAEEWAVEADPYTSATIPSVSRHESGPERAPAEPPNQPTARPQEAE